MHAADFGKDDDLRAGPVDASFPSLDRLHDCVLMLDNAPLVHGHASCHVWQ